MSIKELYKQARDLKAADKARLVDMILVDLDKPDPSIQKIWVKEAVDRRANLKSGRTRPLSYQQVMGKYK